MEKEKGKAVEAKKAVSTKKEAVAKDTVAKQKRTRTVKESAQLTMKVDAACLFRSGKDLMYPVSLVQKAARSVLPPEVAHRFYLNKRLGKYNIREVQGIPMISVKSPMASNNCSVVVSFTVKGS